MHRQLILFVGIFSCVVSGSFQASVDVQADHSHEDHHGDDKHDDHHEHSEELCELKTQLLTLRERMAHQDVAIAKQNTEIQKQNTVLAQREVMAMEIKSKLRKLMKQHDHDVHHDEHEHDEHHDEHDHDKDHHHDDEGWVEHGEHHFLFNDTEVTWREAFDSCRKLHSKLAEPSDADIDSFLGGETVTRDKKYWIAGFDFFHEGSWRWWSTNQEFVYTNWLDGEPNNGGREEEDCLLYNWSGLGKWADAPCRWKMPFICCRM